METIGIANPFPGAENFLIHQTESTQEEARRLARRGCLPGSLVAADFQTGGRGRFPERSWESPEGENLLFTIFLEASSARIAALPLRAGLALAAAVGAYATRIGAKFPRQPQIKWPNDLLIDGKKLAGILCEASAEGVFVGMGLNCNQIGFSPQLQGRASSLALELGRSVSRWAILELFLDFFKRALEDAAWKEAVERRLWLYGCEVAFYPGLEARGDGGQPIRGMLEGLDNAGSILIRPEGESMPRVFPAGELTLPSPIYKVVP